MSNVEEIGKLLPGLFRNEIRRGEPHLLEILDPLWPRIAGKGMAQHSQPSHFASGVLTVAVDSATWSKQLRHLSEEIRAGVNGALGQGVVKRLRIKTVTQHGLFTASKASREVVPPQPPAMDAGMDTTPIADPTIAAALANSYAKYFNRPRR
jgi:hypothetical protein